MTPYLLIQAAGATCSAQYALLEEALAASGVRCRDIHQQVMVGRTVLMLLVERSDEALTAEQLQRRLAPVFEKAALICTVEAVDDAQWEQWTQRAAVDRQIMTVMGPALAPQALAQAERLAHQHGLATVSVERRSRLSTAAQPNSMGECVQFTLQGELTTMVPLRHAALALGQVHGVDVVFQPDDEWRHRRRLVCFDMDSTLIKAEVIDELAKRHGVGKQVADITVRSMHGELDFAQSFAQRVAMLKGLDSAVIQDIADHLPLMDGATLLFSELKRLGYRTAILSGGFTCFAQALQERLGIDEVHTNTLDIDAAGKVTGRVISPLLDAQRKADILRHIAVREGIALAQTVAVGDGANDLNMLDAAGLGVAWHAKPKVKLQARQSVSTLGLDALLYLLGHKARPRP